MRDGDRLMSEQFRQSQLALRNSINQTGKTLLLFYIWGLQWIVIAGIDFFGNAKYGAEFRLVTVVIAIAISIVVIFSKNKQLNAKPKQTVSDSTDTPISKWRNLRLNARVLIPLAHVIGSVFLLIYILQADLFFIPILRALVLSFFYVVLGVFLGRQLIYLGLWLFALCAIVSIWYLGFAPLVLELFGGLSLVVCGRILQIWGRDSDRHLYR